MPSLTWRNAVRGPRLDGRQISVTALMICFPVIGLDQFLRTASGRFSAQPYAQVEHWTADSLIMLPLFAAGVWAGDWVANVAGLGPGLGPGVSAGANAGAGTARRADLLKRALVITLFAALAQVPAWFVVDRSDNPVTAQPLVAPQAHDGGDVYWVAPWVVIALVCVCLAPVAVWVARAADRRITARRAATRRITTRHITNRRLTSRIPAGRSETGPERARAAVTQAALLVPLLAVAALGAWALHQAAARAYASQVYYTTASSAITRHPHVFSAAGTSAAPFAFGYQAAHALQDGLAGQAIGFPVAVIALLWVARGPGSRNQAADTKGGVT
jgi:hypothetical protein